MSPPLLPVQQQIRSCTTQEEDVERRRHTEAAGETNRAVKTSLTLFPHLDILLTGHVFPPGLLDGPGVAVKLALPRLFQQKELWAQNRHRVRGRHTSEHKPKHTWADRMDACLQLNTQRQICAPDLADYFFDSFSRSQWQFLLPAAVQAVSLPDSSNNSSIGWIKFSKLLWNSRFVLHCSQHGNTKMKCCSKKKKKKDSWSLLSTSQKQLHLEYEIFY